MYILTLLEIEFSTRILQRLECCHIDAAYNIIDQRNRFHIDGAVSVNRNSVKQPGDCLDAALAAQFFSISVSVLESDLSFLRGNEIAVFSIHVHVSHGISVDGYHGDLFRMRI